MSKQWLENVPAYFEKYVAKVSEEDIVEALSVSAKELEDWGAEVGEEKAHYAYDEGKWTTNEVILHIIDTERIFQYRSLCIARGEMNGMPGFEQNSYAKNSEANKRTTQSLMDEFRTVRASSISLFDNLEDSRVKFKGMANGLVVQPVLYGFLMTGHLRHHLDVLKTRY
ncbi:MAG: damage-inducible protein DinB [Bacteroidetes bacterium]|nr:MAG: damage-inducible protein DinB [Bacteroidota bacterium]